MFLKITRSGPRQYLQLVEAFRDDAGKAKHRTLVTLGRLDQLTDSLDSVISGLLKATGRPDFLNVPLPAIEFESARALGNGAEWIVGDMYRQEVEYELKTLGQQIEPILIVLLGVLVLILALGIFLPMWDLGKVALKR